MTAPVAPEHFCLPDTVPAEEVAPMWRGALIDLFSRLEKAALACLLDVSTKKHGGANYVAWQRFAELRKAVTCGELKPVKKRLATLLEAIERHHDLRTGLAHGVMKSDRTGLSLSWKTWTGKSWKPVHVRLSWFEALERLNEIEKLQRDFASQCGQVRRLHALTKTA